MPVFGNPQSQRFPDDHEKGRQKKRARVVEHEKLSREETLSRTGFESVDEVAKRSLFGRMTGVPAQCTCGAYVEPDGECQHGHPSVLRGAA